MVETNAIRGTKELESLQLKVLKLISDIDKKFEKEISNMKFHDISQFVTKSEVRTALDAIEKPKSETAVSIRNKLETLEEDDRLDKKAIKGLETYAKADDVDCWIKRRC